MWLQTNFILDIQHFGKVSIHKVFENHYNWIEAGYANKQVYMESLLENQFPNALKVSICEIDVERESSYQVIERYAYEGSASFTYAAWCFTDDGELSHTEVLCIHPNFSFCVEHVLKEIVTWLREGAYSVEIWKDGVRFDIIKLGWA
jgi:hypothetical protein